MDAPHVAIDDHSRYAYVEALPDERRGTPAGFLARALAHFRQRGVPVRGLRTDNGGCYRFPRPYRPQTNGKAERIIRILQDEWACARPSRSQATRQRQLPRFLAACNHQRPRSAIGGAVLAARL